MCLRKRREKQWEGNTISMWLLRRLRISKHNVKFVSTACIRILHFIVSHHKLHIEIRTSHLNDQNYIHTAHFRERNSHECANKGLPLAVAGGDNALAIRRPLEIVDPTREDTKLLFQNKIIVGPPDPNGARHVSRGDPLAVGRVAGDGGGVHVLAVNLDLEGAVEVANHDGSAIAVEDWIGFRVAWDQDAAAPLRRRHARVGFCEFRHWFALAFSLFFLVLRGRIEMSSEILRKFIYRICLYGLCRRGTAWCDDELPCNLDINCFSLLIILFLFNSTFMSYCRVKI